MDTSKSANEVLLDAERRIGELASVAVAAKEHDAAIKLTELAKTLFELADSVLRRANTVDQHSAPTLAPSAFDRTPGAPPSSNVGFARKRTPNKGDYPQFFRRGDDLIKIGWSKTEKDVYEHKAPRRAVDVLVSALEKKSRTKMFTMDDLLPLADASDQSTVPGYQAYVCLAWLKALGLVRQHGRQGYSIPNATTLKATVANEWTKLVAR